MYVPLDWCFFTLEQCGGGSVGPTSTPKTKTKQAPKPLPFFVETDNDPSVFHRYLEKANPKPRVGQHIIVENHLAPTSLDNLASLSALYDPVRYKGDPAFPEPEIIRHILKTEPLTNLNMKNTRIALFHPGWAETYLKSLAPKPGEAVWYFSLDVYAGHEIPTGTPIGRYLPLYTYAGMTHFPIKDAKEPIKFPGPTVLPRIIVIDSCSSWCVRVNEKADDLVAERLQFVFGELANHFKTFKDKAATCNIQIVNLLDHVINLRSYLCAARDTWPIAFIPINIMVCCACGDRPSSPFEPPYFVTASREKAPTKCNGFSDLYIGKMDEKLEIAANAVPAKMPKFMRIALPYFASMDYELDLHREPETSLHPPGNDYSLLYKLPTARSIAAKEIRFVKLPSTGTRKHQQRLPFVTAYLNYDVERFIKIFSTGDAWKTSEKTKTLIRDHGDFLIKLQNRESREGLKIDPRRSFIEDVLPKEWTKALEMIVDMHGTQIVDKMCVVMNLREDIQILKNSVVNYSAKRDTAQASYDAKAAFIKQHQTMGIVRRTGKVIADLVRSKETIKKNGADLARTLLRTIKEKGEAMRDVAQFKKDVAWFRDKLAATQDVLAKRRAKEQAALDLNLHKFCAYATWYALMKYNVRLSWKCKANRLLRELIDTALTPHNVSAYSYSTLLDGSYRTTRLNELLAAPAANLIRKFPGSMPYNALEATLKSVTASNFDDKMVAIKKINANCVTELRKELHDALEDYERKTRVYCTIMADNDVRVQLYKAAAAKNKTSVGTGKAIERNGGDDDDEESDGFSPIISNGIDVKLCTVPIVLAVKRQNARRGTALLNAQLLIQTTGTCWTNAIYHMLFVNPELFARYNAAMVPNVPYPTSYQQLDSSLDLKGLKPEDVQPAIQLLLKKLVHLKSLNQTMLGTHGITNHLNTLILSHNRGKAPLIGIETGASNGVISAVLLKMQSYVEPFEYEVRTVCANGNIQPPQKDVVLVQLTSETASTVALTFKFGGSEFSLASSMISGSGNGGGHAVAGVMYGGAPYILDSNGAVFTDDWTNGDFARLSSHYDMKFHVMACFYVKKKS